MWKRILTACLLSGCRACDESTTSTKTMDVPTEVGVPTELDAESERVFRDTVRYDCEGIEPDPMTGPCESHAPGDDLIAVSDDLTDIVASHFPPTSASWGPATRALARAETVEPSSLDAAERVALQNAAFHLQRVTDRQEPALSERARKLVKRLAFRSPPAIAADLEPWLGNSSEWTQRAVPIVPFVHEQFYSLTRVLRIVRTPSLRANFSKLIAVDESGRPFVSEVIGSIEIRRGLTNDASACVIVVDPARLRCHKLGGLRAIRSPKDLPHSPFLGHDDTRAKCGSCHMELDKVVGLELKDAIDPDHDRKVLAELTRPR